MVEGSTAGAKGQYVAETLEGDGSNSSCFRVSAVFVYKTGYDLATESGMRFFKLARGEKGHQRYLFGSVPCWVTWSI